MRVRDVIESLQRIDPDDTVVVGDRDGVWSHITLVEQAAVNLGTATERCARLRVAELPRPAEEAADRLISDIEDVLDRHR